MHKPESVLKNKILWDLEIQTNHLIAARKADWVIVNKKKRIYQNVDFAVRVDYIVKTKEKETNTWTSPEN